MTHYLITGGAGFIGSHLVDDILSSQRHTVTVIDNLTAGRIGNLPCNQEDRLLTVPYSVLDARANLERHVQEADIIYHLAASVGVLRILEGAGTAIENNVETTRKLFSLAAKHNKRILFSSSSEVYGKGTTNTFREDDDIRLGPTRVERWSYACSKMLDEFIGLSLCESHDLPLTIFRPFNITGPRQVGTWGMVVPRFTSAAVAGGTLSVYGTGRQIRCFLHVKDAIAAMRAMENCGNCIGQVINLGNPNNASSVLELAIRILKMTGGTLDQLRFSDVAYGIDAAGYEDIDRRVPNIDKLTTLTGWTPKLTIDDILNDVIRHTSATQVFTELESAIL